MKNKSILIIILSFLCLVACSSGDSEVDNMLGALENIDLNIKKEWDGINYNGYVSDYGESTQGFYYYDSIKKTVMYVSKEASKAIPLCTKIECVHGSDLMEKKQEFPEYRSDCNAVYEGNTKIQIYNGKLYADTTYGSEDIHEIICADMDGTNRQVVVHNIASRIDEEKTLLNKNGDVFMWSLEWSISDDKVYVLTEVHIKDKDNVFGRVYVDMYDLATGELSVGLFYKEYDVDDLIPSYLYVASDCIYIGMRMYIGNDENQESSIQFIEIDKNTGEYKEINFGQNRNYRGFIYADDKILFGKEGGDVYTLDVDGNEQMCIELEEDEKEIGMYYKKQGDYIFLTIREAVELEDGTKGYYSKVYDEEYNYLDTVYSKQNLTSMAGETDKILFKERSEETFFILDIKQIGTGNIELKEVELPKLKKDNNANEE